MTSAKALGLGLWPPVSASLRKPWLFSFLMLLNSSVGKQHSCTRLGLQDKPNPGKWAKESRLHWHGLASVLLPDLHLMLHKREVSVTQFADHLPRGHALSVLLVPSSPDVLDRVWNAHARNPGKQQSLHKSCSDLVVRWEPSVRRHHPPYQPRGPVAQSSWGDPSMVGSVQQAKERFCDCGPTENTCNVWTLARANLFLSLERNLLTLTAKDLNGYFGFLSARTGDVFLRMAPLF